MDKRSANQSSQPPWYEMRSETPSPTGRSASSAVNVINITRRPEGGIVNIEVRRQESASPGSPNVVQSRTFSSRETSPTANVFARIPPLPVNESRHPIDVRLRGGLGTIAFHRPLADLVRAMHGQSLFERFNEPAPPFVDAAHTSMSSGRRVHTIPIRVEGRTRMGGSAPPSPQRVYEIPVNILSSKSQPSTPTGRDPKLFATMNRAVIPSDVGNDTEKKLASLMSHLESEMNFGSSGSPVRKKFPDVGLPPAALSKLKSPPPYDGSRGLEFTSGSAFREETSTPPADSFIKRDLFQQTPQTTPISDLMEPRFGMKAPGVNLDSPVASTFHCQCSSCGDDISTIADACQAMGRIYHNGCFCCSVCKRVLRGKSFYEVTGKIYCEEDYLKSGFQQLTEKCDLCGLVIADLEVQAIGKSFHVGCFRCQVCNICLSETSFTTDLSGRILCLSDYYRLHADKCSICGQTIIPIEGSYESVKVVMLDKDYCIGCFSCHDCGRQLSDKASELCYPVLGMLFCRDCHVRHLDDTGRSACAAVVSSVA